MESGSDNGGIMALYTTERIVRAPREKVFQRWVNIIPELPRLFPDWLADMRIVEDRGNERTMRCTEIWAGRQFTYTVRQRLFPSERAEGTVIEGEGKGSSELWTFESVAEGTRIRMTFRPKGAMRLLMVLFRKRFAREFEGRLDRWKQAIEASAS